MSRRSEAARLARQMDAHSRRHHRCATCSLSSPATGDPAMLWCNNGEYERPWLTIPGALCEAYAHADPAEAAEWERLVDLHYEAVFGGKGP